MKRSRHASPGPTHKRKRTRQRMRAQTRTQARRLPGADKYSRAWNMPVSSFYRLAAVAQGSDYKSKIMISVVINIHGCPRTVSAV